MGVKGGVDLDRVRSFFRETNVTAMVGEPLQSMRARVDGRSAVLEVGVSGEFPQLRTVASGDDGVRM